MGITLESEMFPYGVIGVASRGSFKRLVIQNQSGSRWQSREREHSQSSLSISVPCPCWTLLYFRFLASVSVHGRLRRRGGEKHRTPPVCSASSDARDRQILTQYLQSCGNESAIRTRPLPSVQPTGETNL